MRVISLALASILGAAQAKPFEVSVDAPFHEVSDSVLTLETIGKYNSSSYFPLLSILLSDREKQGSNNYEAEVQSLYENAVKSKFLEPEVVGVVKQDAALGSVLPLIEGEMQLFESINTPEFADCAVVYWNEGTYSCDKMGLYAPQTGAESQIPDLYPTDHVIGTGDQWVVVYADFEHPQFAEWHASLLEIALSGKASYVLRHRTPVTQRVNEPVSKVAGYAVSANIKRTDYLVIDDRNTGSDQLEIDLDAPHSVSESDLPLLDFAAVKQIRELKGSDAEKLELLKKLSYEFPIHAPRLAEGTTAEEMDKFMENLDPYSSLGFNGAFVDGVLTKFTDINSLFTALTEEQKIVNIMKAYVPSDVNVPQLLTSGLALDTEDLEAPSKFGDRYDLRVNGGVIGWINDVERDSLYAQLQSNLELLHATDTAFAPVRRNIHSIVIAGDIEDQATLQLLGSLLKQASQQLPLQIGFVSTSPAWQSVASLGLEPRQAFVTDLLRGKTLEESEKHAVDLAAEINTEKGHIEADEDSALASNKSEIQNFLERFGISDREEPSIFVNGRLVPLSVWRDQAMDIFEADAALIRSREDLESIKSIRDELFKLGSASRNNLLDPIDEIQYTSWPVSSPIQAFRNPDNSSKDTEARHTVLISSSFADEDSFDLADLILERSQDQNDVDLYIRPTSGIDQRFYASLFDPTYNMFRFSRDLMQAAKGHLLQNKTEPRVFSVAKEPEFNASSLPSSDDYIILDGRFIYIKEFAASDSKIDKDTINKLLAREAPRVSRVQRNVPEITGMGIAALTAVVQSRTMITDYDKPDIHFKGAKNAILLTIVADPASSDGQELISIADTAVKADLNVQIFLSPAELKTPPSRIFCPVYDRTSPYAKFENLADDVLYSVDLLEPPTWLTMTKECNSDLDNVLLNQVEGDKLSAVYSLNSLLIEGYTTGNDAPGNQLDFYDSNGTKIADTVVMANLGYFQFHAPHPGSHKICLTDKKSSFRVSSKDTTDCIDASVFSYENLPLRPEIVSQPPTQSNSGAISANTEGKGIWNKFGGIINSKSAKRNADKEADINIFTVASGHLYERFANIMMLSVMRHAKHTVKFWFVENFLSPKFKELLPELAQEYDFKYEYVTYKWPAWLRGQTEKQREIWGYKMLFLDVMFPQSLSNVIFVDSDQIARTDFKELLDIDLKGAPYAFVPMGDDREETEPYRFWKQGFWKQFLGDKGFKYHISALYRVDLKRFRKTKLGDILRQQYQRLSANPENLSNLDQDLPNSLQSVVPIYSLPQDWLWCETWCSDESLASARTIDLCNNPLTKESKLDRARRQIPEWTEYDNAVAAVQASVDAMRGEKNAKEQQRTVADVFPGDHPNEHQFDDEVEEDHDEL